MRMLSDTGWLEVTVTSDDLECAHGPATRLFRRNSSVGKPSAEQSAYRFVAMM